MRLSISNSDPYKNKIIFLFILTFVLYIFVNAFFEQGNAYYIKKSEKYGIYSGDVQGKFHLIRAMFGDISPDVIFIGNSITALHINTSFFHQNKIKSANYATAGYFIAQYPAMIRNAISLKPKIIAISILLQDFYKPSDYYVEHYHRNTEISFKNLRLLFKHATDKEGIMLLKYVGYFLKNHNYFIREGYLVSSHLSTLVKTHQGFRFISGLIPKVSKKNHIHLTFDCRIDAQGHRTTNCFNGDFALVGHRRKLFNYREKEYCKNEAFNYYLLSVFNDFFDQIKKAGIQPMLILIPSFNQYVADNTLLKKNIHATVVDLSDMKFSINNFADFTHFNMQGREAYSLALVDKVKPLLL